MSTLCELTADWLKRNGYSGLAGDECGCELGDLMTCDEPNPDCQAGHLHTCSECPRREDNDCPMDSDCTSWCVTTELNWPDP